MHVHEVDTNEALVHQLLEAQFPHWAHLPIRALHSAGTDNTLYRKVSFNQNYYANNFH